MKLKTLFQKFNGKCFQCQIDTVYDIEHYRKMGFVHKNNRLEKDGVIVAVATREHNVPKQCGAANGSHNIVLLCQECNMANNFETKKIVNEEYFKFNDLFQEVLNLKQRIKVLEKSNVGS